MPKRRFSLIVLALVTPIAAIGQAPEAPPCRPCAGLRVSDPRLVLPALATAPRLEDDARLYLSWPVELDGSADRGAIEAVREAGGTPWLEARLRTPAPIGDHLERLDAELRELAELARLAGQRPHLQISWPAGGDSPDLREYAFLLKRAAVAITGARSDARVLSARLEPDPALLDQLYAEDVAAYVDGIALRPGSAERLAATLDRLAQLDPGKPVVVDARPWPEDPRRTLPLAAADAEAGVALTFFRATEVDPPTLAPLKLLAREFRGDLSFDPYSSPRGEGRAWAFVRGEDLGLRVVVELGQPPETILFSDPQLRSPELVDLSTGEERPIFDQSRSAEGLAVTFQGPGSVVLLRLARMSVEELAGVAEAITVESERQLPVEEILRRLQAFEDAQSRRLRSYTAIQTMHLRFRLGGGVTTFEATFEGPLFYRRGQPADWVWESFYVNGVKWRRKKLPELPLIQAEKAAALPLEIHFSREYRYRLRGTETVDGRPTWIIDFEPAGDVAGNLYRGTVWIDRELHARVRTRAVQIGLEGDVISNEETLHYTPIDTDGRPAAWQASSFILPLRIVGQQLFSILNATTQVEKETLLTDLRLNGEGLEERLQEAYDSDGTMLRDTAEGLRYLKKNEAGERIVEEEFDTNRLFILGGTFYDSTTDFPIPLAGVNYLALDFRGSGNQLNAFFAGALLTASFADPDLFGSRWDAGLNLFGLFIRTDDELFRDGEERPEEELERLPLRLGFSVGRPLGSFFKLDFDYGLSYTAYDTVEETAEGFVVPEDTLTQSLGAGLSYRRAGYRFDLGGSLHRRSDWRPWGLPGSTEFDPEQEDYLRWDVSFAKVWWLKRFFKLGVEVEHLDGSDLDRFSKYDFGFFGDSRVRGYPNGFVRAAEADGLHLTYGINLGQVMRVELAGDAVWASDPATGLRDELLGGVGFNGTVIGPWGTIVNFDLGVPVAGPADDFVVFLTFLKLWR